MTTTGESRPVEQEPKPINWKAWLSLPRVALWEGVALVQGIDPRSLRQSDNGWMAGPGNGPVFVSSSFPSASKRDAFDDAMGWAERAADYGDSALIRLTVGFVHGARYRNAEVSLTEVVALFVGMDWPGIPAPLLGAMKPLATGANTQLSESAPAVARGGADSGHVTTIQQPKTVHEVSTAPQPLTTAAIAECFAGLGWKTAEAWKKPLGDVPKWLASCLVQQGQRGVRERLWNPVQIGAALVAHKHLKANNIRARFQTMHLLMPWLDAWKTYEADYLDTQ